MWSSRAASRTKAANSGLAGLLAGLLLAGLACGPLTTGPDTVATVNAVSTQVQETLDARVTAAAPAPTTPLGADATALIQPVTRTPPPPASSGATTPALPNSPTFAAPPASPTPPLRPNGALIVARRWETPPNLDGDLGEWPDLPGRADQIVYRSENWTGAADLSARFALGWDDTRLFVAADVTDDVFVQTQRGEALFRGDSLELLVDTALDADFGSAQLSGDDYQLGLSPGTSAGDAPESFLWFPPERDRAPVGDYTIVVAARRAEAGYTLEAAIPWLAFRYAAPPAGWRAGFVLALSDNDTPDTAEQQSMVASVPGRRLTDPTTWGTLELGE